MIPPPEIGWFWVGKRGLAQPPRQPGQPQTVAEIQAPAQPEGDEDQEAHRARSARAASTSAQVSCGMMGPSRQRIPANDLRTQRHNFAARSRASVRLVAWGMG